MKALWLCVVGVLGGCVADVETEVGGADASEAIGEAQEPVTGYNCAPACEAAGVVTRNYCNNIPARYAENCRIESRDAVNACVNEPALPGCQDSCRMGWYSFNRDFCNQLPKREQVLRTRCWGASNAGRAACIARGSMGFRR